MIPDGENLASFISMRDHVTFLYFKGKNFLFWFSIKETRISSVKGFDND